jgi:hypothetical protein
LAEFKDHVWTWDFVLDRTTSGSALKWLSIVDEFTRVCRIWEQIDWATTPSRELGCD